MAVEVTVTTPGNVIEGFAKAPVVKDESLPRWLWQRRQSASESLASIEFPETSEEIWRYSRVDQVAGMSLQLATSEPSLQKASAIPAIGQAYSELAASAAAVVVVSRGKATWFAPGDAKGISFARARDFQGGEQENLVAANDDFFGLYARTYSPDFYRLVIPADTQLGSPVVVVYADTNADTTFMPQLAIEVGPNSQVNIVEVFAGLGAESLLASSTELMAAASSRVGLFQLQNLDRESLSIANVSARLAERAELTFAALSFGGHYARVRTDTKLAGEGARADLFAAYFADGDQMLDFRTLQDHQSPGTYSNLLFKGAVAGESHSVYSGLVRIEEGSVRSDAFQTSRNLVLAPGARADSVPNLDIRENNVRCSHASAVGPIDPELVFYLESRGISPDAAKRLIIRGFFKEILEDLGVPALAALVSSLVDDRLEAVQ